MYQRKPVCSAWVPALVKALVLSVVPAACLAQQAGPIEVEGQTEITPEQAVKTKASDFVIAPIPVSNPSVGSGLAVTGMWLYQTDPESPESFTGAGGGYTSNHSWLAAAIEKLNFDQDLYRLTAGAGYGQANYNFFGIGAQSSGSSIPLEEKVYGGLLDFRRKIFSIFTSDCAGAMPM